MNIKYFSPHWGSESLSFNIFAERVRSAGFDGVEMSLPLKKDERNTILHILKDHGLALIAQHWETIDFDFAEHKKNYEIRLRNLASCQPMFINSQTGKDYYTFSQNKELIDLAKSIAEETGIKIVHETHRGKFSFAAHITKQYLEAIPELQITLDASHWCNVAESYLEDQTEAVDAAIAKTFHIHARVGHSEGPQVPDPRDELWNDALNVHVNWWKKVAARFRDENHEFLTITPEFGAPPYMTLLPGSHNPIANQWDLNVYMKDFLSQVINIG